MIDQEPIEPDEQTITIRRAGPADAAALEQLATLDGRRLGAEPLLAAESAGDGTLVAALSLADGTVVGDPFRYTLEAVAQLRARADELSHGCAWRRAHARQVLKRIFGPSGRGRGHGARSRPDRSVDRPGRPQAGPAGRHLGRDGNGQRHEHGTWRVVEVHRPAPLHRRRRKRRAGPRNGVVREPHDHLGLDLVGGGINRQYRLPRHFHRHRLHRNRVHARPSRLLNHPHVEADHDPAAVADLTSRSLQGSRWLHPQRPRLPLDGGQEDRRQVPNLIHHPAVEHRVSRYRLVRGDAEPAGITTDRGSRPS